MQGHVIHGGRPIGLEAIPQAIGTAVVTLAVIAAALLLIGTFLAERRATGQPSFVSRYALRTATRVGAPLWERLPFWAVATGLAVALLGWRAGSGDGPFVATAINVSIIGLGLSLLGGVTAGALAHPPASVVAGPDPRLGHPAQAHRVVTRRGRLGAGPIGAALIVIGSLAALLAAPVAMLWRLVQGSVPPVSVAAHAVVLTGILLACLGTWGLRIEGRRAVHELVPRHRSLDVTEIAGATIVVLGLSVAVDGNLPWQISVPAILVVLLVVRARTAAGAALAVVAAYAAVRVLVSVLTVTFVADVVPLAGWGLLLALGVEIVVGIAVLGRRPAAAVPPGESAAPGGTAALS